MTSEYHLVHAVLGSNPGLVLKILKDGYLYSGFETGNSALFGSPTAKYIYFSLLNEDITFKHAVTFIINGQILYDRPFRYSLGWFTEDLDMNIEAKHQDINKILQKIANHIKLVSDDELKRSMSHEILIRKQVNLHKYLVAICCSQLLTPNIINYVKQYYPRVKILDKFPETSQELNRIFYNTPSSYKSKYHKYKRKYLHLKDNFPK